MTIAGLTIAQCCSCNAQIYWLKNDTTGRPAPIDAREDPSGAVTISAEGGELRYHVLTKAELEAGVLVSRYTNHFQTCPNAKSHKKGG